MINAIDIDIADTAEVAAARARVIEWFRQELARSLAPPSKPRRYPGTRLNISLAERTAADLLGSTRGGHKRAAQLKHAAHVKAIAAPRLTLSEMEFPKQRPD